MNATDNTTVVAYINKQGETHGGTHSHAMLRLVVIQSMHGYSLTI